MEIRNGHFCLNIYGFSGVATNKDYARVAFKLMDMMWKVVKANHLENKGRNIFVYEDNERVFAGVELLGIPDKTFGLELKMLDLPRYAYHKHIGPYHLIKQAGQAMREAIKQSGLETCLPYIEIYGHHQEDASLQETELLMCLR